MAVIPELLCSDIAITKDFYIRVLGFCIKYERVDERFVFLTRDGNDIMFEQANGPGRRWITAELDVPFGRGINFECGVPEVGAFYDRVKRLAPCSVYLALEQKMYQCGVEQIQQTQFVVQDPDGYLFRFCDAA